MAFFLFKWTLNLSNFKHYSDSFVNMAFFSLPASLPGSGAIVAAIVVGVIIIFTVVLLILKTYNRYMAKSCSHQTRMNPSPCCQLAEHFRVGC